MPEEPDSPLCTVLTALADSGEVELDWTDVPSQIVGYNVCRSEVEGGPYTALNDTPVTESQYQDDTATEGTTYYYVVKTVTECNAVETESGPTAEVSTFEAASNLQLPGDCNQDGAVDLSDVICLLGHLFQGLPEFLPCENPQDEQDQQGNLALMDCNQDEAIDLSDAIYKLAFLFSGGSAPVQGVECLATPCGVSNPACP